MATTNNTPSSQGPGNAPRRLKGEDQLQERALEHFRAMVDSVGVKRFAEELGVSSRQVNRILASAQPNPLFRLILCLQACHANTGDLAADFLCQQIDGYFVREESELTTAAVNAVKECAEAIACISDGHYTEVTEREIREAISALTALGKIIRQHREAGTLPPPL